MKPFDSIDLIIAGIAGYILGMLLGLLINYKRLKSLNKILEYEVDEAERSYNYLLDKYINLYSSQVNLKMAKAKTKKSKRGPGRPKGSKNKATAKKTGPKTKK